MYQRKRVHIAFGRIVNFLPICGKLSLIVFYTRGHAQHAPVFYLVFDSFFLPIVSDVQAT